MEYPAPPPSRVGRRQPKLTEDQAALAQRLYDEQEKTSSRSLRCWVPRPTVYGHLDEAMPRSAEEVRGHEAVKATSGLLVPWCLG